MNLRPEMVDAPGAMHGRPIDHRGFYVPWFVTGKDDRGLWDFTRVDPRRVREGYERQVCFVSGEPLGRYRSFVIGPMCCINRITAEPPVKREVAEWSVRVCPWISNPAARRPEKADGELLTAPGIMIKDNPGICAIWTVERANYRMGRDRLIRLGDPTHLEFYTQKRKATQEEIRKAMVQGAAKLMAIAEPEGEEAIQLLERYLTDFGRMIERVMGFRL